MSITVDALAKRLTHACDAIEAAQDELTDIDSHFGDADHGITMTKIAKAIRKSAGEGAEDIKTLLDDCACEVMMINGGSAVPLWNVWLDGLQEAAPAAAEADCEELKAMFTNGLKNFSDLSKAKVGDKTMMDTLDPAVNAFIGCTGSVDDMFAAAAQAAEKGAESTRDMVSKFGRARSYGEKTLGTPDAGAMSMKYFFTGLAQE